MIRAIKAEEEDQSGKFQIFVKTAHGTRTLVVTENDKIQDVIFRAVVQDYRIVYRGRTLDAASLIKDCNIEKDADVQLLTKMAGAGRGVVRTTIKKHKPKKVSKKSVETENESLDEADIETELYSDDDEPVEEVKSSSARGDMKKRRTFETFSTRLLLAREEAAYNEYFVSVWEGTCKTIIDSVQQDITKDTLNKLAKALSLAQLKDLRTGIRGLGAAKGNMKVAGRTLLRCLLPEKHNHLVSLRVLTKQTRDLLMETLAGLWSKTFSSHSEGVDWIDTVVDQAQRDQGRKEGSFLSRVFG